MYRTISRRSVTPYAIVRQCDRLDERKRRSTERRKETLIRLRVRLTMNWRAFGQWSSTIHR